MNNQLWQPRRLWLPIAGDFDMTSPQCCAWLCISRRTLVFQEKWSFMTAFLHLLCISRTSRLRSTPTMTSTRVWTGTSRRWSRLWAAQRKPCSSNTDWMTWINAGVTWRPNQPTSGQLTFIQHLQTEICVLSSTVYSHGAHIAVFCSFAAASWQRVSIMAEVQVGLCLTIKINQ